MPARKNQGMVNLIVLGLKHIEKDLLPLSNKVCSVKYVEYVLQGVNYVT